MMNILNLKTSCLVTLIVVIFFNKKSLSVEYDLTVDIQAGRRECFYQLVKHGSGYEIEYQVIEGGDLDINFMITSPTGRQLVSDLRKSDALHKLHAGEQGDHAFCFDNTFSSYTPKVVFFEIVTDDEDLEGEIGGKSDFEALPDDNIYDVKLDDFREGMDRIKKRLERSEQNQNMIRVFESRSRSIMEDNFERVNFWSAIQLFVMISVAVINVVLIRSLFDESSRVGKVVSMKT